jgi:hypothetical protein
MAAWRIITAPIGLPGSVADRLPTQEPEAKRMAERIQLKRSKGWRMPENTVKVDRSTRWGNPFTADACGSIRSAVERHARWMAGEAEAPDGRKPPELSEIRRELGGRNLGCWCSLKGPCHADLLIRIANAD